MAARTAKKTASPPKRAAKKTAPRSSHDRRTADSVQQEFDAFKQQVIEVAQQAKEQHGWCEEIDNALTELGLQTPNVAATITITVTDLKAWVQDLNLDPDNIMVYKDANSIADALQKNMQPEPAYLGYGMYEEETTYEVKSITVTLG